MANDFPSLLTNAVNGVTEILADHINNLENKVGVDDSVVVTSLDYLIKNPLSLDPGHKHSQLFDSGGSLALAVDAGNMLFSASKFGFNNPLPAATVDILDSLDVNGAGTPATLGLQSTATGTLAVSKAVTAMSFTAINHADLNGKVLNLYGMYGAAWNPAGYLLTTLCGNYGRAYSDHTSGVIPNMYGLYGAVTQQGSGGTVTNAYGMLGYVKSSAGGTITTAAGAYINVVGPGTITTGYGIFVNGVAGTTKWGVYVNDSGANNYFAGNVGIGAVPTAKLDVNGDTIRVRTAKTPATPGDTGNQGDICWDADYAYVCVANNTWKRAALNSW